MKNSFSRPDIGGVKINDAFWTPYLNSIRDITLPYTLDKFEETGYIKNFLSVAAKDGESHQGPPFSDGLLLETLRGACDFLNDSFSEALFERIERLAEIICAACDADEEGFLCTAVMQDIPDKRWGENGGDIVMTHDIYNMGTLIEAAISHYRATQKTYFLKRAVKVANNICRYIGDSPKHRIIPGHSLTEEAFVKLYRLFRDDRFLDGFAAENAVDYKKYLETADFWYRARGTGRVTGQDGELLQKYPGALKFNAEYRQNHLPFEKQKTAVGHSVRATLCYLGAAAVAYETENAQYIDSLNSIWKDVTEKKLHITGGVGSCHDIEGFDAEYNLPNDAYLETCAAIGFAFWNGEMSLLDPDSKYFDCFELSLYNNILDAVGDDFTHFFYQNPLSADGSLRRWDWHACPCCPPMLIKLFASLGSYIYSFNKEENILNINLFIGSKYENGDFAVSQENGVISLNSKGKALKLRIRIPAYAKNFIIKSKGAELKFNINKGYAEISGIFAESEPLEIAFNTPITRICANPEVKDDIGLVAVMYGRYIMCAEGADNNGNVDITLAEAPEFEACGENVKGKAENGEEFTLIPYYRWCNRGDTDSDRRMAVWLKQENMLSTQEIKKAVNGRLYCSYEEALKG